MNVFSVNILFSNTSCTMQLDIILYPCQFCKMAGVGLQRRSTNGGTSYIVLCKFPFVSRRGQRALRWGRSDYRRDGRVPPHLQLRNVTRTVAFRRIHRRVCSTFEITQQQKTSDGLVGNRWSGVEAGGDAYQWQCSQNDRGLGGKQTRQLRGSIADYLMYFQVFFRVLAYCFY